MWARRKEDRPAIRREEIKRAVSQLMGGGDEDDERRPRVREAGEVGTSWVGLDRVGSSKQFIF